MPQITSPIATFLKTSLKRISHSFSDVFKTSLKLAHYFLTLKILLYKLAQIDDI